MENNKQHCVYSSLLPTCMYQKKRGEMMLQNRQTLRALEFGFSIEFRIGFIRRYSLRYSIAVLCCAGGYLEVFRHLVEQDVSQVHVRLLSATELHHDSNLTNAGSVGARNNAKEQDDTGKHPR